MREETSSLVKVEEKHLYSFGLRGETMTWLVHKPTGKTIDGYRGTSNGKPVKLPGQCPLCGGGWMGSRIKTPAWQCGTCYSWFEPHTEEEVEHHTKGFREGYEKGRRDERAAILTGLRLWVEGVEQ
jgi:hypothetical protein